MLADPTIGDSTGVAIGLVVTLVGAGIGLVLFINKRFDQHEKRDDDTYARKDVLGEKLNGITSGMQALSEKIDTDKRLEEIQRTTRAIRRKVDPDERDEI